MSRTGVPRAASCWRAPAIAGAGSPLRIGVSKIEELVEQLGRQVVHAVVAQVLEDLRGLALPGAGEATDNEDRARCRVPRRRVGRRQRGRRGTVGSCAAPWRPPCGDLRSRCAAFGSSHAPVLPGGSDPSIAVLARRTGRPTPRPRDHFAARKPGRRGSPSPSPPPTRPARRGRTRPPGRGRRPTGRLARPTIRGRSRRFDTRPR